MKNIGLFLPLVFLFGCWGEDLPIECPDAPKDPEPCYSVGLDDGICTPPETAERTVTMCGPDSDDVYMLCAQNNIDCANDTECGESPWACTEGKCTPQL